MRRALAAFQGQRIRISATVHRMSSGNVLLRNVSLPIGGCRYTWVPKAQWCAGQFPAGSRVELLATIMPYWRACDDSKDFGLVGVVRP